MRRATERDWARLFYWRNDEATRAASVTTEPVTLKGHMEWLRRTLASDSTRLYIHEDSARSWVVGTGRLDLRKVKGKVTAVEVSLTLDPQRRADGYAGAIIQSLLDSSQVWQPHVPVAAFVRLLPVPNYASLRAFASAGFSPVAYEGDFVELR